MKRGKCVVLVTHQHQFLGDARCVLLRAGRIACVGAHAECVAASNCTMDLAAQNRSVADLLALEAARADINKDDDDGVTDETEKPQDDTAFTTTGRDSKEEHKERSAVSTVKRETFFNCCWAMPGSSAVCSW